MSDVHPSHVLLKTPLVILVGFQLVNTSAEKSVSALQLYQAAFKSPHLGNLVLKLVNAGFKAHASWQFVASGISSRSKLVNEVHCRKALVNVVAVGSGVLNEVSPLPRHASDNPTPVLLVPSLISEGNDVSEVQSLQAPLKNFPFPRSKAGKELSVVSRHVSVN